MSGFQKNGLPVEVIKFDTIGTHEWGDTSTWPATDNSTWECRPEDGQAIVLTEVMTVFCEDTQIPEDNAMLIEFWIKEIPTPVRTYCYKDFRDWFARSFTKNRIEFNNQGMLQFDIPFSQPPALWSSSGIDMTTGAPHIDAQGNYKLWKMTIRLANDTPYLNSDGDPAALARGKYVAEIYEDPDYVAPVSSSSSSSS